MQGIAKIGEQTAVGGNLTVQNGLGSRKFYVKAKRPAVRISADPAPATGDAITERRLRAAWRRCGLAMILALIGCRLQSFGNADI
jgi:hypothetical protein